MNLQQYSVFIDSGQAWYKLSAYLMCLSAKPDNQAYVSVYFVGQDSVYISKLSVSISKILFVQFQYFLLVSDSTKGTTLFSYVMQQDKISTKTRYIIVTIGANVAPSIPIGNQTNECYIDAVHFYILKQLDGIQYSCFQKYPLIFDYFPFKFRRLHRYLQHKTQSRKSNENRPTYLWKKKHIQSTT